MSNKIAETKQDVLVQLSRIDEIQAELLQLLLTDDLIGLEDLLLEKDARTDALLYRHAGVLAGHLAFNSRLEAIKRKDQKLMQVLKQKLQITRNQLIRVHDLRKAADGYSLKPAKAAAMQRTCTDVIS